MKFATFTSEGDLLPRMLSPRILLPETLRGVVDMPSHQPLVLRPVPVPVNIEHFIVFVVGPRKVALPEDAEVPAPFDRFEGVFIHPDQHLVGAGSNHVIMEAVIEMPVVAEFPLYAGELLHLIQDRLDLPEILLGGRQAGKPAGVAFDHLPDFVIVYDFPFRKTGHDPPFSGLPDDQAGVLQLHQGLADRGAADAERPGRCCLRPACSPAAASY